MVVLFLGHCLPFTLLKNNLFQIHVCKFNTNKQVHLDIIHIF